MESKSEIESAATKTSPALSFWRRFDAFRGSTFFIVLTVSLAVFTDIFLYGIIVPVVPYAFPQRMGVPEEDVQKWISVSLGLYSAGLVVASPICGYFADKMPSRRITLWGGLVVLIGSTILLCLSTNIAMFIVGRLILGASGGVVWTVGLALISDVAPPDQVVMLMGYPGAGMSLGLVFGPLLGGIVYEKAGYYAVYGICFGVLGLDVLLRILLKEPPKRQSSTPPPEPDTESRIESGAEPEAEAPAATAETMAMFLLLKSPRVLNALLVSLVYGWIFGAFDAVLTVHVKQLFGFNSLQACLMYLCIGIPQLLGPLIGMVCDRYGTRLVVTGGFLLMGPFLLLLRLSDHNSTQQIVQFAALLSVAGIGFACVGVTLLGELTNAVVAEEAKSPGKFGHGRGFGQIYGLFNVGFALGTLIGPFQAGGTLESEGWGMTSLSLAIVSFIAAFPALYFFDGSLTPILRNRLKKRQGE